MEIILSLALLSIFATLLFRGQFATSDLVLNNARNIAAANFASTNILKTFSNEIQPVWFGNMLDIISGPFGTQNEIYKTPISRCEFAVMTESFWRTGWNSFATSSSEMRMPDFTEANKIGGDCGGEPPTFSDLGFIADGTVDLGSPVSSVDVLNSHVFVGLKPTLPNSATFASVGLDSRTPNFLSTGFGINAFDAAENYVFAAQNSSTSQLAIINVDNPALPRLVATSTLPGLAGGSRPEGVSITYYDSKVFIGTKRTAGNEFHIFDVSNPAMPVWLGSKELNHNINDIFAAGGYAFLATSGNISDIIILDIRNPAHINQVAAVDLPGSEDGRSIYVVGNEIFLGRYKSTSNSHYELYSLRYTLDPNGNFQNVNVLDSATSGDDVNDLVFSDGKIFAATKNSHSEVQIYGIDEHDHMTQVSARDLPAQVAALDTEDGEYVFGSGTGLNLFKQN